MQKIYELSPTEGHEWVIPDDPAGYEHVKTFITGGRYEKKWGTMEARLEKSHGKKRPKETEIPWLGSHVLFLKQKGLDSLKDILDTNGVSGVRLLCQRFDRLGPYRLRCF